MVPRPAGILRQNGTGFAPERDVGVMITRGLNDA